jgi:hypothetical protein
MACCDAARSSLASSSRGAPPPDLTARNKENQLDEITEDEAMAIADRIRRQVGASG